MAVNIKPILDSAGIALERSASDAFGAAVDDFARGTLSTLGISTAATPTSTAREPGNYYAGSYAAALAGGTNYRPKLKFLFKVEFVFTQEAIRQFPWLASASANDFTFLVKTVDRPKVDFEYEDDINMYNFRTKVRKKIRHRELTMSLMDDTGNRVFNFFRTLMMLYSPITRRSLTRDGTNVKPDATSLSTGNGMEFTDGIDMQNIAHSGVINSPVGNAIETIRVKQMFVDPSQQLNNALKEVIFDFINARLVSFDLDDLSHESSEANVLTLQFDYDWMEMVDSGSLSTMDGPNANIIAPGLNGVPADMTPAGGATNGAGGLGNVFAGILANSAGRAVQSVTSSAVNSIVKQVAGNNRFAGLLGSSASTALGGLIGAASKDLIGAAMGRDQATARATAPLVSDNTGAASGASVTYSSDAYLSVNPTPDELEGL